MINYEIDKNKIKNNLTIEQINELIYELSGEYARPLSSTSLMCKTVCHGGDSFKLYYYDNTKLFRCYTQCGETFDIFELIMKVKHIELIDAIWYVINCFGLSEYRSDSNFSSGLEDWEILNSYDSVYKEKQLKISLKEYDDSILDILPFIPFRDWLNESISVETQERYNIRYYPTHQTILIPHYNINNNLIGIKQRTIVEEDVYNGKYRPALINGILYNYPIALSLFGIDKNLNNIKKSGKCIIFESEKSVMKMDTIFGPEINNSVATSGMNLNPNQVDMLLGLDVEEIIIAYDRQFNVIGDNEYNRLVKILTEIDKKYRSKVKISFAFDKENKLPYKASPIDEGKETFIDLIKNRIFL